MTGTLLDHIGPLAHEIADAAVNWGGYADDGDLSDRLSDIRAAVEVELRAVADSGHKRARLEYLRSQIDAECISYGELAELQGLAEYIAPEDVQLLEWAGVPEKLA